MGKAVMEPGLVNRLLGMQKGSRFGEDRTGGMLALNGIIGQKTVVLV